MFGMGQYDAARSDRSATRNWMPRAGSPDSDSLADLEPIRSRTRDLARNAPLVAGALETKLECIIGPGLVPHPRLDAKFLGLTPEQAADTRAQMLRLFWHVAGGTRLDIRNRKTFAQMSISVLQSVMTDGDHGYRRRFKVRPGDLLGLKVQQIEADRITNPDSRLDTDTLREGVALDDDGAHIGYWVADRHPGEMLTTARRPKWSYQPAFDDAGQLMRLVDDSRRDGQTRGVSMLAPIVEAVKQLTRFGGAELDAAVVTSFISLLVKSKSPGLGLQSMGIGSNPASVGLLGGPASASGVKQVELAPAAILQLMNDEEVTPFNPQRPNSGFESFFRAWCSIIGVAIGLPHELLIKHFTSSFSASRGAMLEAWRHFKTKRSTIVVDQWAQPIWEWILDEGVARGYIDAPGYFDDPFIRAEYTSCQWTGPIMGQLNPQQEMAAVQARLDSLLTTHEEERAELTGGEEWDTAIAEIAREQEKLIGLNLRTDPAVAERLKNTPPSPDDADERETRSNRETSSAS